MVDLLGSFLESVRVRTKHTEKTHIGLWGQSTILKAVWDVTCRVHYLGRTSLGGHLDTTSTPLPPRRNSRVFVHPILAGIVGHGVFAESTPCGLQTYLHKQIQ